MNEPLEQSMAGETGQEQSLELADRLLRRRTEPVGVINAHHPQQMYDRTAGLVARRFSMLDHWRTRYASAESSAASKSDVGGDFALTSAPFTTLREKVAAAPQISRASASPVSPRSVTPESSAQTTAQVPTQASPTAHSPMMRVMRRARPVDAAQPSSTPSSHSPMPVGSNSTPMAPARAGGEVAVTPPDTPVQRRQSGEGHPADAGSGAAGKPADLTAHTKTVEVIAPTSVKGRVVDAAASTIRPLALESIPSATRPVAATRLQRKADEAPGLKGKVLRSPVADEAVRRLALPTTASITERVAGKAHAVGSPGAARSSSPAQAATRLQRKADEAPGLPKGNILRSPVVDEAVRRLALPTTASITERVAGKAHAVGSPDAARSSSPAQEEQTPEQAAGQKAEQTSGVSRLPLASALVQRQAAPGETAGPSSGETHAQSREDPIDNSALASAPQTPGGKPAVAVEIPNPSSAQAPPKIIWRKGAENSSTASLPQSAKRENITPAAPMIARRNESGSTQTAETFTPASSPSPSGRRGGGVDVEQLAEQVSRLLARQLQIERERRGIF